MCLDVFACQVGSKLALIEGTPCHTCYARKLQKLRPSVDKGWKANLDKWRQASTSELGIATWIAAMVLQITRYNTDGYHRWFDSGDLQSVEMLDAICQVARATPDIKHWLPTQERGIVSRYTQCLLPPTGKIPSNLIIRVSASKLNGPQPKGFANTSQVFTGDQAPLGSECHARHNDNNCGDCRACWDPLVEFVSYPKH